MGNSIRRVGLLSTAGAGEDEPFHYQLGRKVSIDLSGRYFEVNRSGFWSEKWTMSYTVDLSTCTITITRSGKDEGAKALLIQLFTVIPSETGSSEKYVFDLDVHTVTESDALINASLSSKLCGRGSLTRFEPTDQIHPGSSVTETLLCLFGAGDKGGLNVLEMKKKIKEEQPYAVTLAHYFAITSAGIIDFSRTKTDAGLSVVVKIRASDGNLDITVEGPDQHPGFGLRYLFGEAVRTKIWKPTLCPHCANIQKQRSTMIWQSESDDSESVPVARRHGGGQKILRTVNNGGRFNGNGNGNFIENKYMFFGKRWW
ncbi:uncharacterized protein LOC114181445 [Vigna unguiculata]|uniref:uncharacterized protein LOC114181445 n=1 Tax=Vigna unguiculata TaxID=3917 RepID=UPI001016A0B9|nr:uncharacterized protein LOC114181445 [Vigna unguiculata]